MSKKVIFPLTILVLAACGFFLFSSENKVEEDSMAGSVADQELAVDNAPQATSPHVAEKKPQPEKVLSAPEVSDLQKRSEIVNTQLENLAKDLDEQLENAEQRAKIEASYQELVKEQNQLAIQLVKANQQAYLIQ